MRPHRAEADLAVADEGVQPTHLRFRRAFQPVHKRARDFACPLHPTGFRPVGGPFTEVNGLVEVAVVQFPDNRLRMRVAQVGVRVVQEKEFAYGHES